MVENVESLIRFAIPGGYALMIVIVEQALLGWAWRTHDDIVSISSTDALITLGGAVAASFVLTVIYRVINHCRRSSSADLGANALEALEDIHHVEAALITVCGPLPYGLGPIPDHVDKNRRREVHDERLDIVRSVLKLACKTGDREIASSYNDQVDWYHVYGACRTVVVVILVATTAVIAGKQGHQFAANLGRSVLISALLLALGGGAWWAFGVQRQRVRCSMTRQLAYDLRAWAIRHPRLWARLADAKPSQQDHLPSDIQAYRGHQEIQA
jgi:hypothetical protein